jgi:alpha-galactosidase
MSRRPAAVATASPGVGGDVYRGHQVGMGQVANLPRDAVVETMGRASRDRVEGVESGEMPPAILAVVLPHVLRQEMTVEAAITGNRRLALQVLATDPLMKDLACAAPMLDELLRAHRAHLSQF